LQKYTRVAHEFVPGQIRPAQLIPTLEEGSVVQVKVDGEGQEGGKDKGAAVIVAATAVAAAGAPKTDIEQEWELTKQGKKLFMIRQDGRIAPPQQGAAKWWNM
jgi:hypothetical protein